MLEGEISRIGVYDPTTMTIKERDISNKIIQTVKKATPFEMIVTVGNRLEMFALSRVNDDFVFNSWYVRSLDGDYIKVSSRIDVTSTETVDLIAGYKFSDDKDKGKDIPNGDLPDEPPDEPFDEPFDDDERKRRRDRDERDERDGRF